MKLIVAFRNLRTHLKLENVEYSYYLVSMITNDTRCIREIKSRIIMAKKAFSKKKDLFTANWTLSY
jgi:hypothetical protein